MRERIVIGHIFNLSHSFIADGWGFVSFWCRFCLFRFYLGLEHSATKIIIILIAEYSRLSGPVPFRNSFAKYLWACLSYEFKSRIVKFPCFMGFLDMCLSERMCAFSILSKANIRRGLAYLQGISRLYYLMAVVFQAWE